MSPRASDDGTISKGHHVSDEGFGPAISAFELRACLVEDNAMAAGDRLAKDFTCIKVVLKSGRTRDVIPWTVRIPDKDPILLLLESPPYLLLPNIYA